MLPRPPRYNSRLRLVSMAFTAFVVFAFAACQPPNPASSDPDFRAAVSSVDWELIELNGKTASAGAGGRRATLRFNVTREQAGGFAGCNHFGGAYTVGGDSLRFGDLFSTQMACAAGMELESEYLAALQATRRYELSATQLKLFGPSGPVARFSRQIPEPDRSPDT
jgi:heat shock protein HslJ